MLSVLITHTYTQIKKVEGTFEGDGYTYSSDCGDGLGMYTYLQTHQVAYIKFIQLFIHQSYLNTVV